MTMTKLLNRHTEAGITICYDDHCVSLRKNGELLGRVNKQGARVVAVWTGEVTIAELTSEADKWLDAQKVEVG